MKNEAASGSGSRRRRVVPGWVFAGLCLAALTWLGISWMSEPAYQGTSISRWIDLSLRPTNEVVNAFGTRAVPYLAKAMKGDKSKLHELRVNLGKRLPQGLQKKFPFLVPIDPGIRREHARQWLLQLGPDASEAVPELIDIARHHRDVLVRCSAMNTLACVGPESPAALDALTPLLKEPNVVIQDHAAFCIGLFGTNAQPAVRPLIEFLKNHPRGEPYNALSALGQIGAGAEEAVPEIVRTLNDDRMQANVIHALVKIGPGAAAAVPTLLDVLQRTNTSLQILALDTLRQIGPPAQAALPQLHQIVASQTGVKRILASVAIANIEENSQGALPTLLAELTRNSPDGWQLRIRTITAPFSFASFGLLGPETAAWFLGEIGPPAHEALPRLRRMLKSPEDWRRVVAARSLWKIGQKPEEVLPVLEKLMRSQHDFVDGFIFNLTVQTLTEMGPAAKPLAPSLVQFIDQKTNSWSQRKAALTLLQQIEPDLAKKTVLP